MDFDIGIPLVIFETDIIFGAVLLDEVHLKDERFKLRADHDPLNVHDLAHEAAGFAIVTRVRVEVGTHTVLQADGLANVNNCPLGIAIDITAWFGRHGDKNAL